MEKKFSIPRGTNDILPEEVDRWTAVERISRRQLSLYNYKEIRTPLFEETELFSRSVGQTSDIVQKQMLNLAAQQSAGEQGVELSGLSLRPEGTASIVRSYIERDLDKKERISKLFYIGPMFRGERPQKGRLRQFHQIGVEAIGSGACSPYLDAEIIALSVDLLKHFGLRHFKLNINSLGSAQDKRTFSDLLKKALGKKIPHLCPDCQQRFDRNVFRVLDCKNKMCKQVVQDLRLDYSFLSAESAQYYQEVKDALKSLEIPFEETIDLVRGLDYYTHTVFELTGESLGSQDALGAGGRYSNLVAQLGGRQVEAIGFALGIERILLALPEAAAEAGEPLMTFVVALDDKALGTAFQTVNLLRKQGISSDINYSSGSAKSQMRQADKSGARFVLIFGEEEMRNGVVTIRDMRQGQQKQLPRENLRGLDREMIEKVFLERRDE